MRSTIWDYIEGISLALRTLPAFVNVDKTLCIEFDTVFRDRYVYSVTSIDNAAISLRCAAIIPHVYNT